MKKSIVLLIALLMALCLGACASETADMLTGTSTNHSDEQTPPASEADLQAMIEQTGGAPVEILNVIDLTEDAVLVDYDAGSSNSFAICHLTDGIAELLPVFDVELTNVVGDSYFIFEDRGEATDSPFRAIPIRQHCFRTFAEISAGFAVVKEQEYFSLDRSIQFGSKNDEQLAAIMTTFDGVQMCFKPADEGEESQSAFYMDATDTPEIKTSCNLTSRQLIFEISTDQLAPSLQYGVSYPTEENLYISAYELLLQSGKTQVVLTLREATEYYGVEMRRGPMDDVPYISITFL